MKLPALLRSSFILLTSSLLFACASPMVWEKPGSTEADFHQAVARNQAKATRDLRPPAYQPPPPVPAGQYDTTSLSHGLNQNNEQAAFQIERETYFRNLMMADGWRLVPAPSRPK